MDLIVNIVFAISGAAVGGITTAFIAIANDAKRDKELSQLRGKLIKIRAVVSEP